MSTQEPWLGRALRTAAILVALGVVRAAPPARAQVPPSLTVTVRQVAGSSIYLDVGTAQGLATGDTLRVARDSLGGAAGRLTVTASSETRSVLTFVGAPFVVRSGDALMLFLLRAPPPVPERTPPSATGAAGVRQPAQPPPSAPPPSPPAVPPARSAPQPGPQSVSVAAPPREPHGRLALDLAGVRSDTRLDGVDTPNTHVFATPALIFDLSVPSAVAGFDFRGGARFAYRYADPDLGTPAASTRVYSVAVERRFVRVPLRTTLGRFHSPDESYSGFWDGLHMRYGGASGVALLVGFQPDRWNERPSFDRPKASVVVDATARGERWRWAGDVSAHQVSGSGQLPTHSFAGLSQSLLVQKLRLSQDLQVDRDPATDGWRVSRLGVRGSLSPSPFLDLRLGWHRRESYRDWWEGPAFSPREDRLSGGFSVFSGGAYFSADASRGGYADAPATSYSASFRAPGFLPGGTALEGSGSYWSGSYGSAWSAAPSLSFGAGAAEVQLGYGLYGSDFLERELITHAGQLSLDFPMGPGSTASVRMRVQRGGSLSSEDLTITFYRVF